MRSKCPLRAHTCFQGATRSCAVAHMIVALLFLLIHNPAAVGLEALELPRTQIRRPRRLKGLKPPLPEQPQTIKESYRSVRESMEARWPSVYSTTLPCRDATKTGYITKNATIGESATLRVAASQAVQYNTIGLPIYAGCQVRPWASPLQY